MEKNGALRSELVQPLPIYSPTFISIQQPHFILLLPYSTSQYSWRVPISSSASQISFPLIQSSTWQQDTFPHWNLFNCISSQQYMIVLTFISHIQKTCLSSTFFYSHVPISLLPFISKNFERTDCTWGLPISVLPFSWTHSFRACGLTVW